MSAQKSTIFVGRISTFYKVGYHWQLKVVLTTQPAQQTQQQPK